MKYLKNHVLASLSLVLVCTSCKHTPKNNAEVEQLQQELNEVKTELQAQKASNETKNSDTFLSQPEAFLPMGAFSTSNNLLLLHIPVSSKEFNIVQKEDISSKNINALVVRVTDDTNNDSSAVKDTISEAYKLTDLQLDTALLRKHQKLKVIVLNSTEIISEDEIDILKNCIKKDSTNYKPNSCLDSIRKYFKPNSKNGDIIIGI